MNAYTRRDFVKAAAVTGAAVSTFNILGAQTVAGINTTKIKVGLIGCGGRGSGALKQFKEAAKLLGMEVEVVGVADAFKDKVDGVVKRFKLDTSIAFHGFDHWLTFKVLWQDGRQMELYKQVVLACSIVSSNPT